MTLSPARISFRLISSWLCSVARPTFTPPTIMGSSTAYGFMAPVLPTCVRMSIRVVTACSAGNLYAVAQRGSLPTLPSLSCNVISSNFTTTPSIPKSSSLRALTASSNACMADSGVGVLRVQLFTLQPQRCIASSLSHWVGGNSPPSAYPME